MNQVKRWGTVPKIVLICRPIDKKEWKLVPNLSKEGNYKAAEIVLTDTFNEYMAYINSYVGIEYRYVRQEDLGDYGISECTASDRPIKKETK